MMNILSAPSRLGVSLVLAATASHAAEPLRWKWAEGDSARYLMTQTMDMKMSAGPAGEIESKIEQQMILSWTADAVTADGEATLSQGFERITMATDGPSGQGFEYDSASDDPPAGMAALIAPLLDALVASPLVTKMLATGEVVESRMSDDLAAEVERIPGGGLSAETVKQMTSASTVHFPEDELEIGETWVRRDKGHAPQIGELIVTTTYTYNGPKEVDGATLESITPRIELALPPGGDQAAPVKIENRASDGEILFDRQTGRIASVAVTHTAGIEITMQGQTVTNALVQQTDMRALEPDETPELGAAEPAASLAE